MGTMFKDVVVPDKQEALSLSEPNAGENDDGDGEAAPEDRKDTKKRKREADSELPALPETHSEESHITEAKRVVTLWRCVGDGPRLVGLDVVKVGEYDDGNEHCDDSNSGVMFIFDNRGYVMCPGVTPTTTTPNKYTNHNESDDNATTRRVQRRRHSGHRQRQR